MCCWWSVELMQSLYWLFCIWSPHKVYDILKRIRATRWEKNRNGIFIFSLKLNKVKILFKQLLQKDNFINKVTANNWEKYQVEMFRFDGGWTLVVTVNCQKVYSKLHILTYFKTTLIAKKSFLFQIFLSVLCQLCFPFKLEILTLIPIHYTVVSNWKLLVKKLCVALKLFCTYRRANTAGRMLRLTHWRISSIQ